ncbi:LytTr DNA-binding domain-containing protein [Tenacibaculum sp. MAR_2010_89]|uniref:LytR/AlgR family response regulator transcription factor n=1 Tax=Tenacibaculum sp. MAR_2010_89 TaxID=1250198 RepID=UPI0008993C51|nr:LytTR family DNA-binding domain-containing protein [Tenacibaculum sp. MAR_2010_89]SEE51176.1 LytTr DNA-binding domain-containing protein [Tenacibaculum sp. MAR_2010_89]
MKLAQIKNYLKEPYPYYYEKSDRLLLLLLFIAILSFLFSYFFEPFVVNVNEHKISYFWILLIHAFTPFPIAYLYFILLNNSKKDTEIWTLGKEIFHLSMILLVIGITSFLIRDLIYTNPDNWSFKYFWEEIRNTFLIGILLLVVVLPINLERLINKHKASLKEITPINFDSTSHNLIISIKNSMSEDCFELKIKDFLFAKVESNYTEVYTFSTNKIHKTLIRVTLKDLEEQLKLVSHNIFKTHRSYLVNLNKINSISGNAQGYELVLKNSSLKVPVSRSNITKFNTAYSKV